MVEVVGGFLSTEIMCKKPLNGLITKHMQTFTAHCLLTVVKLPTLFNSGQRAAVLCTHVAAEVKGVVGDLTANYSAREQNYVMLCNDANILSAAFLAKSSVGGGVEPASGKISDGRFTVRQ